MICKIARHRVSKMICTLPFKKCGASSKGSRAVHARVSEKFREGYVSSFLIIYAKQLFPSVLFGAVLFCYFIYRKSSNKPPAGAYFTKIF